MIDHDNAAQWINHDNADFLIMIMLMKILILIMMTIDYDNAAD